MLHYHGYSSSALCVVCIYTPAVALAHWACPWRDGLGWVDLGRWLHTEIDGLLAWRWSPIPVLTRPWYIATALIEISVLPLNQTTTSTSNIIMRYDCFTEVGIADCWLGFVDDVFINKQSEQSVFIHKSGCQAAPWLEARWWRREVGRKCGWLTG